MQHHEGLASEPAYNPGTSSNPLSSLDTAFPTGIERRLEPFSPQRTRIRSHRYKTHRLAFRRASYFLTLLSALLFLALAFNLAFPRFSPRLSSIVSQVAPSLSRVRPSTSRPLSSISMAPARYQHPPQPPPCFTATANSLLEDTKRLISQNKKVQDDIVELVKPGEATFENTALELARQDDEEGLQSHIIGFYQAISTDKALRDASTEAEKLMSQFAIDS